MADFARIALLRQRRLERRMKAEKTEQAAVQEAETACQAAQEAIDAYLAQTRTLEVDLLTQLLNRRVSVNDLLAVEEILRKTEEKARALADVRAECAERLTQARERVRIAERERALSARKLTKSEHVRDHILYLQRLEESAREEAAIDEFCEQMAARIGGGP